MPLFLHPKLAGSDIKIKTTYLESNYIFKNKQAQQK